MTPLRRGRVFSPQALLIRSYRFQVQEHDPFTSRHISDPTIDLSHVPIHVILTTVLCENSSDSHVEIFQPFVRAPDEYIRGKNRFNPRLFPQMHPWAKGFPSFVSTFGRSGHDQIHARHY